jgi:hypothetical protein
VYERGPKHGIVLGGLKDVTVNRMDDIEETEE